MTRIGRFALDGRETWGVIADDHVRSLTGALEEWAPLVSAGGAPPCDGPSVALHEVALLAPVPATARIVCFGGTYGEHMQRLEHVLGPTTPQPRKVPGAFIKPVSAIIAPGDDIAYPPTTNELDYEIEIVVVIGCAPAQAGPREAILGYTIGNDVSARDAKGHTGASDFFSMKALDRTSPLGPWIVTRDVLGDRPDLELRLTVNGELRQHDRTASLMYGLDELVAHVDERLALRPGDLIWTGTTAGVAWEDGRFLQPGDVVEASIEGIGTLRNTVGARRH